MKMILCDHNNVILRVMTVKLIKNSSRCVNFNISIAQLIIRNFMREHSCAIMKAGIAISYRPHYNVGEWQQTWWSEAVLKFFSNTVMMTHMTFSLMLVWMGAWSSTHHAEKNILHVRRRSMLTGQITQNAFRMSQHLTHSPHRYINFWGERNVALMTSNAAANFQGVERKWVIAPWVNPVPTQTISMLRYLRPQSSTSLSNPYLGSDATTY